MRCPYGIGYCNAGKSARLAVKRFKQVFNFPHKEAECLLACIPNGMKVKSALGIPAATFGGDFLHTNIFEMAAAYLCHLDKNHPSSMATTSRRCRCHSFLTLNGYEFVAPEEDFSDLVFAVAHGELDKAEVTAGIRNWTARRQGVD